MRDYLVLAIIFAGVPISLMRPYLGILFWSWVSYMSPHRLTWGIAYDFPAALVIGASTLVGLVFTRDRRPLPKERETYLLFTLWGLFAITTSVASVPADAWPRLEQVSKILLMTMVTMTLVNTRQRLRWLLLVIALSVGFFGFKGGIFSLRGGGADRVYGPPGSFIEDNNSMALAIVMVLPILFFLALEESRRKWFRFLLLATGLLSTLSVVFSYSRGGFVGLAAAGATALFKSKRKFLGGFLIAVAIVAGTSLIPEKWFARMSTIGDVAEASAAGRINAWHFAWNLASARFPVGGGFETFTPELFLQYAPNGLDFHAAHSIYFEMLGAHGFIGLALFLWLLISTLWSLQRLSSRFRKVPHSRWISRYATMLQISIVGYMSSGAFLGLAYFDLSYHLIACAILLKVFARQEVMAAASRDTGPAVLRDPDLADVKVGGRVG